MGLGKVFEKTIKLVGTVSKVGVQLGADIVGTVAEKINDDPEVKRRISEYGAKKGQSIKAKTSEVASKSSDIVNRAFETSMNVLKDGSVRIKDSVSQVAEGVDSSIKGMKNYNSQTMQSHSNTLPLETYSIDEIKGFTNYDFLIISKFISVSDKIVFDIVVKSDGINVGSYILVNNTSGTFATRIISIDSAVNEYDILKDGTINIIKKGVPRCRELYETCKRNEVLSIVVQGKPANYRFIGRNELAKGTISTEKVDTIIIGLKSENGQTLIGKLKVGDSVKLIREPNNIYNKDAIAVYNVDSEMIGYIAKDDEKELANAMDLGADYKASVTSKVCGDGSTHNVYVQVSKVYINSCANKSNISYQNQNTECGNLPIKQDKNENKSTSGDSMNEYGASTKKDEISIFETVINSISIMAEKNIGFLQFVSQIPQSTLSVFLQGQYQTLKTSNKFDSAHLGHNGCFEFAGTLLLSVYSYARNEETAFKGCRELIYMAFKGASGGTFSDHMDDVINNETNIEYEEWSAVYRYLRDNYGTWIRKFEFAEEYTMSDHVRYKKFIES
jgi:hypothetical protein